MLNTIYNMKSREILLDPTWTSKPFVIQDIDEDQRASLKFHVKTGDYFGTLATVLSFLKKNSPEKNGRRNEINSEKILSNIIDELLLLQEGYKIIRKK